MCGKYNVSFPFPGSTCTRYCVVSLLCRLKCVAINMSFPFPGPSCTRYCLLPSKCETSGKSEKKKSERSETKDNTFLSGKISL